MIRQGHEKTDALGKIPLISSPGVGDYNIEHDYILAFTRPEPDTQFSKQKKHMQKG